MAGCTTGALGVFRRPQSDRGLGVSAARLRPVVRESVRPVAQAVDVSSPLAPPGIPRTRSVAYGRLVCRPDWRDVPVVRCSDATSAGRNGHRAGPRRVLAGDHACRRAGKYGRRAVLAGRDLNPAVAGISRPGAASSVPILLLLAATAKMYPVFRAAGLHHDAQPGAARPRCCPCGIWRLCWSTVSATSLTWPRSPCRESTFVWSTHPARAPVPSCGSRPLGGSGGPQAADRDGPARVMAARSRFASVAACVSATRRRRSPPRCVALHVGALIYLGTFAVANNFDYRLVFPLLTLPQLVEWARCRRIGFRRSRQ